MAEVRLRFSMSAYVLGLKINNLHRLEIYKKLSKTCIRSWSLCSGFVPVNNIKGELFGAAERVTAGVSQDTYPRATTVFGNVHVCHHRAHKTSSLFNQTCAQNLEGNVPACRNTVTCKRTFSTIRTDPLKERVVVLGRWSRYRRAEFVCVRAHSGNGTEPLYKTKTGYYEILEVTPNATQVQIKTAYYKQSFIYHPDRNAGSDEATVRFSEISEAYTVLGNKTLRKKYDRGLLSQSDLTATRRPSSSSSSSSSRDSSGSDQKQQSDTRRSVVNRDIRGEGVYDFDKFFKEHYGEQLQRQKETSTRKEEILKRKHESIVDKKLNRVTEVGVWVLVAMAMALIVSLKRG